MVKGLSRKVIIVKSPDPKIFEQAIFIVRDEYAHKQGISEKDLLKQARAAASEYASETYGRKMRPINAIGVIVAALSVLSVSLAAIYFLF